MPRRIPPPEAIEKLRGLFRKSPPTRAKDFRAAGSLAGVTEAMARAAWTRGWVGIEALEVQLAKERAIQAQSADVFKIESLVRAATVNATSLQGELLRLRPAVRTLIENLVGCSDELASLDATTALSHLAKLAKIHKDVSAVSHSAVELRRLIDGEATSIVGHKPMATEPLDLEAAQVVADSLARALRRAQRGTDPKAEQPRPATKDDADVDTSNCN